MLSHATPVPAIVALRGGATASVSTIAASTLGWALTAGSLSVYLPIILTMLKTRNARDSSLVTWAMQTLGFAIFVIYHVRSGLPLSTFLDFASLGVQSLAILCLASGYQRRLSPVVLLPLGGVAAALLAPAAALQQLQGAAALVITLALLPQIVSNFLRRSGGGWSPISAGLSTGGNAIRIFTTVQLAGGNKLLMGQYFLSFLLNGLLLVQSLAWPTEAGDDKE